MKYYILASNELIEVDSNQYELWKNESSMNYLYQDREIQVGDYLHSIETMFQGAIDKGEAVLPFCLVHFKDEIRLTKNSVKRNYLEEDIRYFSTYEELGEAYYELISELEVKK